MESACIWECLSQNLVCPCSELTAPPDEEHVGCGFRGSPVEGQTGLAITNAISKQEHHDQR
jgi:hypothetical protein